MKLTKAQSLALLHKYRQSTLMEHIGDCAPFQRVEYPSFLAFRRAVQPQLCGDKAVMVRWCNMWIGIEPDGYTHS